MNNARMWLVVKPTVGLPLFLGIVLVIAMLVHFAILTHTTWFPAFLQGGAKAAHVAQAAPAAMPAAAQ